MVNDFSEISAESDLRDLIVMSPLEIAEANAWFDQREAEMENRWLEADRARDVARDLRSIRGKR